MITAFKRILVIGIALCAVLAHAGETPQKTDGGAANENNGKAERSTSPWKFEVGVSAGALTPIMLEAGFGYKAMHLHIDGFGIYKGANDFWCGIRGGLVWRIPRDLPFSVEFGIGGGYEFAEAPNGIHQAVNKANEAHYLYDFNFKEKLDISAEMRIHLFGFFTQIDIPVYNIMDHEAPDMLWRIGYLVKF